MSLDVCLNIVRGVTGYGEQVQFVDVRQMDHALLSWLDLEWKRGGHFDSYSRYVSEAMSLRQG